MRRIPLMLFTVLAVSGGIAAAPIAGASAAPAASAALEAPAMPGAHTSGPVCSSSGNACEEVFNEAQGSDYVYFVEVYDSHNKTLNATYRLLFNSTVRYTATGPGVAIFNLDYDVNPGTCIQGGIEGLSDARTPCWYAP